MIRKVPVKLIHCCGNCYYHDPVSGACLDRLSSKTGTLMCTPDDAGKDCSRFCVVEGGRIYYPATNL